MGDQQKQSAIDHAGCLPPLFAVYDPVLLEERIRIGEGADCRFKTDAVLPRLEIALSLSHSNENDVHICTTFMLWMGSSGGEPAR